MVLLTYSLSLPVRTGACNGIKSLVL